MMSPGVTPIVLCSAWLNQLARPVLLLGEVRLQLLRWPAWLWDAASLLSKLSPAAQLVSAFRRAGETPV